MISDQTATRLRVIRLAQLRRVKAAALKRGLPVERDLKVLRDIVHGSTEAAAERSRISESLARHILKRYADIAEGILAEDRRKALNYDEEV